jgi:hypothetical protein
METNPHMHQVGLSSPTFFYVGHRGKPAPSALTPPPRLKPIKSTRSAKIREERSSVAREDDEHLGARPPKLASPMTTHALPTDAAAEDRINAAVAHTWRRLKASVVPSTQHAPAHFMSEITSYVEGQLQQLARQHPGYLESSSRLEELATGQSTLLQREGYRNAAAAAPLTMEERARKARLQVFINAQRMFADSFQTYKLFLDALTDEHVAYDRFVESSTLRYREEIASLRAEIDHRDEVHQAEVAKLSERLKDLDASAQAERSKAQKQRQQLADATRERRHDFDLRKHVQELELHLRDAKDANAKLQEECDKLTRQNNQLTIGTFSDALDTVNQLLAEARSQSSRKDEQLIEAHDDVTALTRDVKKIVAFLNSKMEAPMTSMDIRLSDTTTRVLFPDEARPRH